MHHNPKWIPLYLLFEPAAEHFQRLLYGEYEREDDHPRQRMPERERRRDMHIHGWSVNAVQL
jgi:hypothetical protein